jgi:hypothetical protein
MRNHHASGGSADVCIQRTTTVSVVFLALIAAVVSLAANVEVAEPTVVGHMPLQHSEVGEPQGFPVASPRTNWTRSARARCGSASGVPPGKPAMSASRAAGRSGSV